MNDKEQDRKIICWYPNFLDCLSSTYGSRGLFRYVLCDNTNIPGEDKDPLLLNNYYGKSESLLEELVEHLPHERPIFKNDNFTVYMMIEQAVRGSSVESTIKYYSCGKVGHQAFKALIYNHAVETKYRSIMEQRMNLLQKSNGMGELIP